MKFSGQWMQLGKVILSEVTQTQKDTNAVFTNMWILVIN